jgi:FAD/FMN-containing dehydrogenase
MRSVSVDAGAKTITAQGGALWSDVDSEAEKFGLATVGGTINHTGIGGLTLGGGYGYLTGKAGLVIDNLLEVEMVLADGSIVTVSEEQNVDLFWAIRGAGASFGVATKFVYRAYEQKGPVWGGILIFPPTQLDKVVEFENAIFDESTDGKATLLMGFASPPPAFQPVVMTAVFYNGEEEEAKKFFEPLLSLGPLANMTTVMPYSGANAMLNAAMEPGSRRR